MAETSFIHGLDLSEAFYKQAVRPVLEAHFPRLRHSAALIGSGSEVLGLDTEMSSDHHWGPRALLFLSEHDYSQKEALSTSLSEHLPRRFLGYPTSFTPADADKPGTQLMDHEGDGLVNHRVAIYTIERFLAEYLGIELETDNLDLFEIDARDWLTFPEQKLATITAGRVFHDDLGLQSVRQKFSYYPHDLWLYIMACAWCRIEQEEHLMGRAGYVGDQIGSAIIAAWLVRDLMRLCFLIERRYAPYQKWFGTTFKQLQSAPAMEPLLEHVLCARTWQERQQYLCQAYERVAAMHNALSITEPLPEKVAPFFDRPFLVISMGRFSSALRAKIADPTVREIAEKRLIGNIDQISDNTDILADTRWRTALRELYNVNE